MDDLHNARSVLENRNFRALVHFQGAVEKTVHWHTSITVDSVYVSRVLLAYGPSTYIKINSPIRMFPSAPANGQ